MAASDSTPIGGDLRSIMSSTARSRRTVSTIKQGLFWASAYNVVLIPVADRRLSAWHERHPGLDAEHGRARVSQHGVAEPRRCMRQISSEVCPFAT
jgi:hypothetical protein